MEIRKNIILKSLSSLTITMKYNVSKIIKIIAALSPDRKINILVAAKRNIKN